MRSFDNDVRHQFAKSETGSATGSPSSLMTTESEPDVERDSDPFWGGHDIGSFRKTKQSHSCGFEIGFAIG